MRAVQCAAIVKARLMIKIVPFAALLCLASTFSASAETLNSKYSVRVLGLKVGEMQMEAHTTSTSYSATSRFKTTGLAGMVSGAYFNVTSKGTRSGNEFRPKAYDETMNTGERVSNASMVWQNGVPVKRGERLGDKTSVTVAQQRAAVDPMTALFMAFRDQPAASVCQINQTIFDGKRLTRIVFSDRSTRGDEIVCRGEYQRVAGYSAQSMKENSSFPLTVTYTEHAGQMRLDELRVTTIYGDATIVRR